MNYKDKHTNDRFSTSFENNIYVLGICFSWIITLVCLLTNEPQPLHIKLAVPSFLAGIIFVFILGIEVEITTKRNR